VLAAGYVREHVELAYVTTTHGAQGDTVPTAHVVIGERTGAAGAYVGMTRGRTANNAHLVAADLADARRQWITAFGCDRADLGPAHAAELAAQEAARYAQPRPLETVLADLHAAWTGEQRCLDRLASAESRRDLLRHITALEIRDAGRLAVLEAVGRTTAADAQHARARADASAATITTEAGRLAAQLLAVWDAQRDAASRAAQVVLAGRGRLGLRRAAVHRASVELTAWADTWRAQLPGMSNDPRRLADLAVTPDDRPRLQGALAEAARRTVESAHPDHPRLIATARAAEAAADRDVAAAAQNLAAARDRLHQLRIEPALLAQPAHRLARERDRWKAAHEHEAAQLRTADAPTRLPAGRSPDPVPVGSYAAGRDHDRGVPR
jgi:exodeoxyribonuclease V alpha subunit